ncbi:hypothetical protein AQF52_0147 [Streptomyces venezuelae]|nr:hypothetical protein AQF52_0147 [Streptomyces venezuelae]CUM44059.1 hypothetical protein BN2537_17083 [Streptomyces venezuelae]
MGADPARTRRGQEDAGTKGIRVSVLREENCDQGTGELLGTGYDDHAAAVTSTAAELHRAGIGHRLGLQSEIGHRLGNSFVQRADLVRAPVVSVPALLLEIDRRTEDAHELVQKLRRYWERGSFCHRERTSPPWTSSAPGQTQSRTSTTSGGCGAGSTRPPAGRPGGPASGGVRVRGRPRRTCAGGRGEPSLRDAFQCPPSSRMGMTPAFASAGFHTLTVKLSTRIGGGGVRTAPWPHHGLGAPR